MILIRRLRQKLIDPLVNAESNFYSSADTDNIQSFQLAQFRSIWKEIVQGVEFYKELSQRGELPKAIESLEDFQQLPILSRELINQNADKFFDQNKSPSHFTSTGGSTGNPLRFPRCSSEEKFYEPAIWYARKFYNIKRSDKMFRLWGHSHTLGTGLTRLKNKLLFDVGLPLVGFKRFSAYDLSESNLKEAGYEILKFKPDYIIGYSKALTLLAKANIDKKESFRRLGLKAVVGAAEGFDSEEDKSFIAEVFGTDVGLEYASMETRLMAHTHPDGSYKVLWKNNLLECVDDEGKPAKTGRILVTSLYPRAFPLVRYELGDIISDCKKNGVSVYEFLKVQGRDNDFLELDGGAPIHSEGITHAIKLLPKVSAYQIRYTPEREYTIYLKCSEVVTHHELELLRGRLAQVDKRLRSLPVKQVDQLKQTVAGKTKWLLAE